MTDITLLIPVIIGFSVAVMMMPGVINLGTKYRWIDQPDQRKHHITPVVRVGGIAIFAGVTIAALISTLVSFSFDLAVIPQDNLYLILGGLCFFAIGFADDVLQLPPVPRLMAQVLVTSVIWSMGIRIEYLPIPFFGAVSVGILSLPITILWVSGVANAINWFDGLDGLAAGVGTFSAIILAVTAGLQGHLDISFLALALAGSTLGFLKFNLPPAKLYMGDGGSYLIGYYLATLCVMGLMGTSTMSYALAPFLILGVPIIDMTTVMASRIARGKSPLYPDRRHLHHRLLNEGCSKMFSTGYIWVLSSWVGSLAILITNPTWGSICLGVMSLILAGMTIHLLQVSKMKRGASLSSSA